MKKTMITAATVFAIFASAGASMAGPFDGHANNGAARGIHSSVSHMGRHAGGIASKPQATEFSGGTFDHSAEQNAVQSSSTLGQQSGLYGSDDSAYSLKIDVTFDNHLDDNKMDLWIVKHLN